MNFSRSPANGQVGLSSLGLTALISAKVAFSESVNWSPYMGIWKHLGMMWALKKVWYFAQISYDSTFPDSPEEGEDVFPHGRVSL